MLHVVVFPMAIDRNTNTCRTHKYVSKLNIINLQAHKFYNLMFNFVWHQDGVTGIFH